VPADEGRAITTNIALPALARVVGIHNPALRSGVAPETFEDFITDNIHRVEDYPGWKFHMLKGQGGSRLDQYAVMLEIESLESFRLCVFSGG